MCVLNESRCCIRTGVQRFGKVQSKIFKFVVINWKEVSVFFYNFPNNNDIPGKRRIFLEHNKVFVI